MNSNGSLNVEMSVEGNILTIKIDLKGVWPEEKTIIAS